MKSIQRSFGVALPCCAVWWLGCAPAPQGAAAVTAPTTAAPATPVAAPEPNPGAGNSGVAVPGPPPGPTTVPDKECAAADFVIDDCEDNDNQVAKQGGRNGYWYTYADKHGTTITPPAHTKF